SLPEWPPHPASTATLRTPLANTPWCRLLSNRPEPWRHRRVASAVTAAPRGGSGGTVQQVDARICACDLHSCPSTAVVDAPSLGGQQIAQVLLSSADDAVLPQGSGQHGVAPRWACCRLPTGEQQIVVRLLRAPSPQGRGKRLGQEP